MTARARPTVMLLSGPGSLERIDPLVDRAGVRLLRLTVLHPRPIEPRGWLGRLTRSGPPDTVVVTSRTAVALGVVPWRKAHRLPIRCEFWAVGPGTAQALRRAGVRRVHRPEGVGDLAVADALRRSTPRTIVHLRSDLAGPRLARLLRERGHRVLDQIVYRTTAPHPLTARAGRQLLAADLVIATSPSVLSNVRRGLPKSSFERLRRTAHLVVLGERSQRAARGHGFRHVSVAPSTTAQPFTQHLLRELRDGPR
jgi:uroporphyrinogen-III synthase